jgi:hypothetical protein
MVEGVNSTLIYYKNFCKCHNNNNNNKMLTSEKYWGEWWLTEDKKGKRSKNGE